MLSFFRAFIHFLPFLTKSIDTKGKGGGGRVIILLAGALIVLVYLAYEMEAERTVHDALVTEYTDSKITCALYKKEVDTMAELKVKYAALVGRNEKLVMEKEIVSNKLADMSRELIAAEKEKTRLEDVVKYTEITVEELTQRVLTLANELEHRRELDEL